MSKGGSMRLKRIYGTPKIITKFLLLPKNIIGEIRWLEKATWKRKYLMYGFKSRWIDICWID